MNENLKPSVPVDSFAEFKKQEKKDNLAYSSRIISKILDIDGKNLETAQLNTLAEEFNEKLNKSKIEDRYGINSELLAEIRRRVSEIKDAENADKDFIA